MYVPKYDSMCVHVCVVVVVVAVVVGRGLKGKEVGFDRRCNEMEWLENGRISHRVVGILELWYLKRKMFTRWRSKQYISLWKGNLRTFIYIYFYENKKLSSTDIYHMNWPWTPHFLLASDSHGSWAPHWSPERSMTVRTLNVLRAFIQLLTFRTLWHIEACILAGWVDI